MIAKRRSESKQHARIFLASQDDTTPTASLDELRQEVVSLRESERLYRLLSDKMADIVWIMDLNLRTLFVSPSVEKVLGFTPEERLQQSAEEQLTPASFSVAAETLARELFLESEGKTDPHRTLLLSLEFYHRDGSTRWLETVVTGIRDKEGTLVRLHGVSRDITERRRTEEALHKQEAQYRQLIEKLPIGIVVVLLGRIVYANPAFLTLLKINASEEIVGNRFRDFIPPELLDMIEEGGRKMLEEGVSLPPLEMNIRRRDGLVITVAAMGMPVSFDGHQAILGAFTDITERRLSDIELRKARMLLQIQAKEIESLRAKGKHQGIGDP